MVVLSQILGLCLFSTIVGPGVLFFLFSGLEFLLAQMQVLLFGNSFII